jgi:hypothetical protein
MGDHNEHVCKRLRTVDTDNQAEQGAAQPQVEDADTFEHIKQGSNTYDAQTYGMVLGRPVLFPIEPSLKLYHVSVYTPARQIRMERN